MQGLSGPTPTPQSQADVAVPWSWGDAMLVWSTVLLLTLLIAAATLSLRPQAAALVSFTGPAVASVATVVVYVRVRYRGALGRLWGPRQPRAADVGAGVAYGLVAFVAVNIGLSLLLQGLAHVFDFELPQVQQQFRAAARDPALAPLLIVTAGLLAPFAEELFFRGMLFQALRRRLSLWPAAGLSGLAFGLVHWEPLAVASIVPLGAWLAWTLHRRGTLVVPIVAHATFNLVTVVLLVAAP